MAKDTTEGVDLQQLAALIRGGLDSIFNGVLKGFVYLKKRAVFLAILIVAGIAAGWGLSQWKGKEYKVEVIVQPNMKSKNYLYDAVAEMEANLNSGNQAFFASAGVETQPLPELSVEIGPVSQDTETLRNKDYLKYLELLDRFKEDATIREVIQEEILEKSALNHRLTFTFEDPEMGPYVVEKLVAYINSNPYFSQLIGRSRENSMDRIASNEALIVQIDSLLNNYTEELGRASALASGQLLLDAGQAMDPASLIQIKSGLQRDNEMLRYNLVRETSPVEILNFGKVQPVRKSLTESYLFQIPLLLLLLFFAGDFLRYINSKARELKD
ncbi:hypothetical protein [Robiginitalea sediminis]|uniref:hypothetical protein n=1 Tax=Robiginitalea sediminis TaxID=1982593 RepID=UPI000B4B96A6|nr:hypothetical protein [Robiginitalea sediminis]